MENKKYLLDTNILIEFVHGNRDIIDRLLHVGFNHCCMSIISLQELYYGAYNTPNRTYFEQEMTRIEMLRQRFDILPLPEQADGYGQIKANLIKSGQPVDDFDMLIGGQAISTGLTVVTDNLKHFNRMHGVKVENWMQRF